MTICRLAGLDHAGRVQVNRPFEVRSLGPFAQVAHRERLPPSQTLKARIIGPTASLFCQAGTDGAAAASCSNAVEMSLMLMTPIKL